MTATDFLHLSPYLCILCLATLGALNLSLIGLSWSSAGRTVELFTGGGGRARQVLAIVTVIVGLALLVGIVVSVPDPPAPELRCEDYCAREGFDDARAEVPDDPSEWNPGRCFCFRDGERVRDVSFEDVP